MTAPVETLPRLPARLGVPVWLKIFPAAALIALALYFLYSHFSPVSLDQISRALIAIPSKKLWACAVLTAMSFVALGSYDVVAVRMVAPHRVSMGRAWLSGAIANAISNTLGFHALTSTAVRYRLLSRSGLAASEIARLTALSWSALALGFCSMFSLALAVSPQSGPWQRGGGLLLLAMLLLLARWLGGGKTIRLGRHRVVLPGGRLVLMQMMLGAIEMASAIGALYVLLPPEAVASFPAFSIIYIGAVLLGIASHAPGGLGVFEATILALSSGQNRTGILAALLLYRLIYNLCPFALAALALVTDELRVALSSTADRP